MKLERVKEILQNFQSKRILVIGDLMLDEFVWGRVSRISPEAPVPVVDVIRESSYPGGAANVARNVKEFCPSVLLMGLVGADGHAERLRRNLEQGGINLDAVQVDPSYQTIVKTRIVARQQQVVRVDREKLQALSAELQIQCIQSIRALLPEIDAIIFEDYGKGFLQQFFVDEVCSLARQVGKVVTVDPNVRSKLTWRGVTAVKPNRTEAFAAANQLWHEAEPEPLQDQSLLQVGDGLLKKWDLDNLLITLGEQGMMLFSRDHPPYHAPSRAREVYDVSGAGDTAIALFTLAMVSGATPTEAAELSNHASSVVVAKLGTATHPTNSSRAFVLTMETPNLWCRKMLPAFLSSSPRSRDLRRPNRSCGNENWTGCSPLLEYSKPRSTKNQMKYKWTRDAANETIRLMRNVSEDESTLAKIEEISDWIARTFEDGGKVLICGNGGSGCDAAHFAEEFTGRFKKDRRALPVIALMDPAHITCVANDFGYHAIFSRSVEAFGKKGDVLIGLSTSGNSSNVKKAIVAANDLAMTTIALLGRDGGETKGLSQYEIIVPGLFSDRIQEVHMFVLDMVTELVERRLFPELY
jgi:phosphoheptose isomerase